MRDFSLFVLRLLLGYTLIFQGYNKLNKDAFFTFKEDFIDKFLEKILEHGLPLELIYSIYLTEIIAPALLIIGLLTRLSSALIMVNILLLINLFHSNELLSINKYGYWAIETQAYILVCAFILIVFGSGHFALKSNSMHKD